MGITSTHQLIAICYAYDPAVTAVGALILCIAIKRGRYGLHGPELGMQFCQRDRSLRQARVNSMRILVNDGEYLGLNRPFHRHAPGNYALEATVANQHAV